jgi:glycosyltransferase involved in cell wall biosynthesis
MPNNELVSIVVCCHNRRQMLEHTMQSIFVQHYNPIEIVVLDDGSTDDTHKLMASYGDKVRYYWQQNQGIAVARTNACRLAKGEFIAFQDDDDLMPPDRIVLLHKALSKFPSAVLALGDWAAIDADANPTGERSRSKFYANRAEPVLIENGYRAVLWPELTPTPHTTLFRRADGERIGWFDNHFFHACEDTDFFARCAQMGPIVYVPKVVSFYRRQRTSLSANNVLMAYSTFLLLEKHLMSIMPEQKEINKRLQFRMLQTLKSLAYYKRKDKKLPDPIETYRLKKGLHGLGLKDQLEYWLWTLIRLPLLK